MKFPTTIFITIIVMLSLAVSVFNFIAQEKEAKYLHDEMHILASHREDINEEMQKLSHKINSALQEVKDVKAERVYLEEEIKSIKKQINVIQARLNNTEFASGSETQYLHEERIKLVGIGLPLVPYEVSPYPPPADEKERPSEALAKETFFKAEDSLERQRVIEHFQKALFYQESGELTKALQEYESILRIDPLNAEVYNNMGLLYQQKGEYNKALIAYRKAVLLKPDYNKARSNMGTVLYRQGRLEEAGLEFVYVLEKEPENVHALTNLAIIYKGKGELEKARDLLLKALDFDDGFPEAHYNLALILEDLGRIDEAITHYRAFLKYSHGAYTSLTADVLGHLEVIEKK